MIARSITELSSNATSIGEYAFYKYDALTTADFPLMTSVGVHAFEACNNLTSCNFPSITSIADYAFRDCKVLQTVNAPLVTYIGSYAFQFCVELATADFPLLTTIDNSAFRYCKLLTVLDFPLLQSISTYSINNCSALTALILRKTDGLCKLRDTNGISATPIASGVGYIYVPSALIEQYKAATNWSTYAAQFRALEDYTVDGTVTGELDETKI